MREDLPPLASPNASVLTDSTPGLRDARRRLLVDGLGIMASAGGFGFVYGVAAAAAGFSIVESSAMSLIAFGGAAQFAAVGYVAGGFSWLGIILLTAFLNARHLLYAAALAPHLADRPRRVRAVMAHVITDEAFALTLTHFRRVGRADTWGYWFAGIVATFVPWNVATIAGVLVGGSLDTQRFGLDIVFPAAMAGLAVGLVAGRRDLVAAIVGGVVAVAVSLAWDPAAGIVAGGLLGPVVGLGMPGPPSAHRIPGSPTPSEPRP